MKDADKALIDGLALVTDLSPSEWALVVADVEKAGGIRECRGQARVEIERAVAKARTLVAKHPGHANQAVHGGGKGGSSSAPASSGGKRKGFTTDKKYKERLDEGVTLSGFEPKAKVKSVKDTSPSQMMDKLSVHGGGGGYHGTRKDAKASGRDVSRADEMLVGHAKEKGWSMRDLHEFADSKNGRWFADIMTDARQPSVDDVSRATKLLNEGAGNS